MPGSEYLYAERANKRLHQPSTGRRTSWERDALWEGYSTTSTHEDLYTLRVDLNPPRRVRCVSYFSLVKGNELGAKQVAGVRCTTSILRYSSFECFTHCPDFKPAGIFTECTPLLLISLGATAHCPLLYSPSSKILVQLSPGLSAMYTSTAPL